MYIFKNFPGDMPPDPLEPFLCFKQLEISSAEKTTLKKCVEIMHTPPFFKFLATPLRRDESDRCSLGSH